MVSSLFYWPYSWRTTIAAAVGVTVLYKASKLVGDILFPTILSYPWPTPDDNNKKKRDKKTTVVLAGSYNPPHLGHLAMLRYLSQRYEKVIVVVGMNPNKKYAVTPQQRAELIRKMLRDTPASNVQVEVVKGYIWRCVKREGAQIFFRGIRSWEKDGAEERSLQILNTWGPLLLGPLWWPLPTVFLEGKPEYNHVSSTLIRDLCSDGTFRVEDLYSLVPQSIAEDVSRLYGPS